MMVHNRHINLRGHRLLTSALSAGKEVPRAVSRPDYAFGGGRLASHWAVILGA